MAKRDHSVFPEMLSADGEVLTPEFVAWSLTREGRGAGELGDKKSDGKEYPNPVPLEPPIGYVDHVPLHIQIANMVRRQLAEDGGEVETEEESNDFDVGDDLDPSSPWELQFEPTMSWSEAVRDIVEQAKKEYPDKAPDAPDAKNEGGGGSEAPQAKDP